MISATVFSFAAYSARARARSEVGHSRNVGEAGYEMENRSFLSKKLSDFQKIMVGIADEERR